MVLSLAWVPWVFNVRAIRTAFSSDALPSRLWPALLVLGGRMPANNNLTTLTLQGEALKSPHVNLSSGPRVVFSVLGERRGGLESLRGVAVGTRSTTRIITWLFDISIRY
jgi:hypothetical protein